MESFTFIQESDPILLSESQSFRQNQLNIVAMMDYTQKWTKIGWFDYKKVDLVGFQLN